MKLFLPTFALFMICALLTPMGLSAQPAAKQKKSEAKKMTATAPTPRIAYETVPGDPMGARIYTLSNGMKLIISVNRDEPRVYTNVAVRAGSKHDPAETTGLAHYLEHMLFKGTPRIASLDWEKEKVLLQQISDLYEKHRMESDPEKRKTIYAEIDRMSGEAAQYVAANEYDKMVTSLGAKGTNAYTWVEQTVYVNDIPANEIERWMALESERFQACVLRLFHTELEAVYEEFNISQDNDFRKVYKVMYETLFPTHPYGTQTTIGKGEHLKNPSHVKIHEYFNTYYVPNNMAIVLAGDLDPDQTALLAEKYFGGAKPKPVPPFTFEPQPEVAGPIHKDVFGQEAAYVELHWRFDGANSKDAVMLSLLRSILYNRRAGILDLNLIQKQLVLEANASSTSLEDYSTFRLYAKPREGQTLEEAEQLLLQQLEALKNGAFEEWLIEAVVKDFKLSEMRRNESNPGRVSAMTNAFILGLPWEKYVKQFDEMASISKADLVRFAKERLSNNYVCIYKRTGEDPDALKMEKPAITPVAVNRTSSSPFAEEFMAKEAPRLEPVFLDFKNQIRTQTLANGVSLDYIHNTTNPTFALNYVVEMGKNNDPILALAISYLPYLGTDKYTAEQLKQEFFRLGLAFNVSVTNERMYVSLSGLDESFEAGVQLFEHLLANVKGDDEALKNRVADILLQRANSAKDKRVILRQAMFNYARYGEKNPFTDILPEETLKGVTAAELVQRIHSLTNFEHNIFYYGSIEQQKVADILNRHHKIPATLTPIAEAVKYPEMEQSETEILFVDFPMVQAEILWLSKGTPQFNLDEYIMANLYNEYFGSGLSSIVFQEIRESKALAYSAYAAYTSPSFQDQSHYLQAYVGTQVDKLADALPAMVDIVENMPVSEAQIENARQAILRKIETERIIKDDIYWTYRFAQQRGLDRDVRQDIYQQMQSITPEDLIKFQQEKVKGRKYTLLVMGSKDRVDMDFLRSVGTVKELTLSQIFGFEVKP